MFSNRTINFLHFHYALWIFGSGVVTIFGPIYLLKLGFSLPAVAAIWGGIHFVRFFFRPLWMPVILKIGLKRALIAGTFLWVGIFPLLSLMQQNPAWLWVLVPWFGLCDVAYWVPFHAFYALAGNLEKRGKQM